MQEIQTAPPSAEEISEKLASLLDKAATDDERLAVIKNILHHELDHCGEDDTAPYRFIREVLSVFSKYLQAYNSKITGESLAGLTA